MSNHRLLSHAEGYLGLGMLKEAAAELDRIGPPDDESAAVIAVRIAVLHEQEDWSKLRLLAAGEARRRPGEAASWVTWAYATRRAISLAAAEKILIEAEQHHRSEPTIQFNLGCYACQRGDLTTARSRVDRAVALDETFSTVAATDPDLAPLRALGLYRGSGQGKSG